MLVRPFPSNNHDSTFALVRGGLRDEGLFNISYQWILAGKCMQEYQRSLPLDHEKSAMSDFEFQFAFDVSFLLERCDP